MLQDRRQWAPVSVNAAPVTVAYSPDVERSDSIPGFRRGEVRMVR